MSFTAVVQYTDYSKSCSLDPITDRLRGTKTVTICNNCDVYLLCCGPAMNRNKTRACCPVFRGLGIFLKHHQNASATQNQKATGRMAGPCISYASRLPAKRYTFWLRAWQTTPPKSWIVDNLSSVALPLEATERIAKDRKSLISGPYIYANVYIYSTKVCIMPFQSLLTCAL